MEIPLKPMFAKQCGPRPKPKKCHSILDLAIAEATRLQERDDRRGRLGRRVVVYVCGPCSDAHGFPCFHVGHERNEEGPRELVSPPGLAG